MLLKPVDDTNSHIFAVANSIRSYAKIKWSPLIGISNIGVSIGQGLRLLCKTDDK